MAFQYQLADAKRDPAIQAVAGACPNSADFINLVNMATRRLWKRGNFFETEWLLDLCVDSCVITWPRIVATVLGVRFSDRQPSQMRNSWWNIIGPWHCGCGEWCSNLLIKDINTGPTNREIADNTGKLIRYYITKDADVGKTITLYGRKYGNEPLQEKDSNGNWQMGLTITAAKPFATTTVLVTKIESVVRQATSGTARLYEYNATTDTLIDLATYWPNETNPRYRRSKVENWASIPICEDDNGRKNRHLQALIKLNYEPLVNDNDFLLIDDFDALALAIQAVKLEQANNVAESEAMWTKAIRELNFMDRNKNPGFKTSIRNLSMGSTRIITNPI
jgi:hypothetical protein